MALYRHVGKAYINGNESNMNIVSQSQFPLVALNEYLTRHPDYAYQFTGHVTVSFDPAKLIVENGVKPVVVLPASRRHKQPKGGRNCHSGDSI
jgi:hypothetical protein